MSDLDRISAFLAAPKNYFIQIQNDDAKQKIGLIKNNFWNRLIIFLGFIDRSSVRLDKVDQHIRDNALEIFQGKEDLQRTFYSVFNDKIAHWNKNHPGNRISLVATEITGKDGYQFADELQKITLDKDIVFEIDPRTNAENLEISMTVNNPKSERSDSMKVEQIKKQHSKQLEAFEQWASHNKWGEIKQAHYDWWMFPVNRESSGYGATYKVSKEDVEILKQDHRFMADYRRGVELVVRAWSWDLEKDEPVHTPSGDQYWDGYGVRLAKMSDSLQLFGELGLHNKLKKFFTEYCLPQLPQVRISDLPWLLKTFNIRE